jgi:Fic-DOC domain mobile mystery protein B
MFRRVWVFAGKRRNRMLNIGVEIHQIDTQLRQLLDDVLYWRDHETYPIIEQAARLHHRAVQIHPFENGNGRWSRLLGNIWLKQNDEPITAWPDETIGEESVIREQYIRAIKAADGGEFTQLIELHKRYTYRL